MVWLWPNARETNWRRSDAGYWHHGDPSCEVHSWSRRSSLSWADDEDTHLKSSQLQLPPAPQNSPSSPAHLTRCRSTAGFSIHFITTRLLQLTVVLSAMVNCSASAACHECSGSSHHELVVAQPRETRTETATLAAGSAVSVYAPDSPDIGWGRQAQRSTSCLEQEPDLENVVFSTPVRPPGTLFLPTSTTILIPVLSENDSSVYFFDGAYHWLLSSLLDVSYSGALQIPWLTDWLIDWIIVDNIVSRL